MSNNQTITKYELMTGRLFMSLLSIVLVVLICKPKGAMV